MSPYGTSDGLGGNPVRPQTYITTLSPFSEPSQTQRKRPLSMVSERSDWDEMSGGYPGCHLGRLKGRIMLEARVA